MEVENKAMYHFHKERVYDEIWQENKEIFIDDNFKSKFCYQFANFSTAVQCNDNEKRSFDRVIKGYLNKDLKSIDEEVLKHLLSDSLRIIQFINIYNRERSLEEYRKRNFPHLPSRLHSIWLTDEKCVNFWETQLGKNLKLFKLSVTGNMFKSSDKFIPDDELTLKEMYNFSEKYWNPKFENEDEETKAEYLFQGKARVLERIK